MNLTRQKAKSATRAIAKISEVVEPKIIEKVSRDSDDDHILAAAVVGQAKFLVTADKDLLVLESHKEASIVSPAEFKKQLS